jgi:hypothetical protein
MPIGFDYETFYSSKLKYGLKQLIAEQYVRHELFDPYMLAVCDGASSWAGHPRDFNWAAIDGQVLVSHNRYFDNTVFNEQLRRGWIPKVTPKAWHCTANLTSYLCNRRALDQAVEFLFKIKLDKSARSNADGKHWPQDFSEAERAAMLKYAPADAYWCWKLWNDFSPQWPELEQRLSNQTIEQGMRGVQINAELLNDYIVQSHEIKLNTEKVLPWLADSEDDDTWDEFNTKPTSTKCIAEQCRRVGIPCPPVKANEGEEAFEEWETLYGPKHPWIAALSSWRSINKLYKTFVLAKSRLRDDGTMPFGLKYFGAHTGRWSGAEKINFQNPRKKPLIANQSGLMETNEAQIDAALDFKHEYGKYPEWVKYSLDFRALIIPRPGKKMICCDLAQIEPRVIAWLTGETELMEMIRGGMSVYEAFARTNLGYDKPGKMDKRTDYYKMVKIMKLGLGYQAGWEKFIVIAAKDGVDITKDDPEWIEVADPFTGEIKKVSGYGKRSKEIVKDFRDKSPLLAGKDGLWAKLDGAFKRSIGSDFIMTLPSGRKMSYRKVRSSIRLSHDKEGKPVKKWVFTAESDGRHKMFYGGKLTENLVQATARDVFGHHLVSLDDTFGPGTVLFSSHDEAITEVDSTVTAEDVERVMSQCPEWLEGCPIAAEANEVAHYQK